MHVGFLDGVDTADVRGDVELKVNVQALRICFDNDCVFFEFFIRLSSGNRFLGV